MKNYLFVFVVIVMSLAGCERKAEVKQPISDQQRVNMENEKEFEESRDVWKNKIHRCAPDIDWRMVNKENFKAISRSGENNY